MPHAQRIWSNAQIDQMHLTVLSYVLYMLLLTDFGAMTVFFVIVKFCQFYDAVTVAYSAGVKCEMRVCEVVKCEVRCEVSMRGAV